MGEVELSCLAYAKMYLHASQFPRCSVNGLLLSSSPAGGGYMYHRLCAAASLTLISSSNHAARSHTGRRLVFANTAKDCGILSSQCFPTPCALKIAEKIFEQCNNAVLLMIDGEKMFPGCRVPPIVMYERKDARWALKDKHTIMLRQWEETCSIVNQLFSAGDQALLVDFDSHLDDITKDWTNQKLNAKIMELVSPANGNV
ncbi:ER membrane protein complex subunit 9 [Labeo rohita]|uniref:ER membrane protein complex subunit 9 n=1 Tax=Labeo rohita TaxID=84645 RepID=A0ABQ8M8U6_LABRO|nr:ER membrane protein complex subunit 9 [Labeo rohita]